MKLYKIYVSGPQRDAILETLKPAIEMYKDMERAGDTTEKEEAKKTLPVLEGLRDSLLFDAEEVEEVGQ